MNKKNLLYILLVLVTGFVPCSGSEPSAESKSFTHLGDHCRTGYFSQEFKPPYHLRWTYQAPHKPRPAWPEPEWEVQRIDFDYALPAVADSRRVYISSSADHTVRALDLDGGTEEWVFITGGPVRLAPTVNSGRVYFSSDDGRAYCLDAATGRLIWRFQPEINDQRLIGNGQMISRWASRSSVLLSKGRAYVAFGMWPEGVFIYCLDAQTGKIVWRNDTSGIRFMTLPHYRGMGGVSPQGYLALSADEKCLVVPCGRAAPALFDAKTGRLIYHEAEGLFPGGTWTMTFRNLVFTRCDETQKPNAKAPAPEQSIRSKHAALLALDAATGHEIFHCLGGSWGVISSNGMLTLTGGETLFSIHLDDVLKKANRKIRHHNTIGHIVDVRKKGTKVDPIHALLQAGNTLVAGHKGRVACYNAQNHTSVWQHSVDGDVRYLALGRNALIVCTTQGSVYCFSKNADRKSAQKVPGQNQSIGPIPGTSRLAERMLSTIGVQEGYGLVLAKADAGLLAELARISRLTLYHVSNNSADALRKKLLQAELYGVRVTVHETGTRPLPYTDYFADMILADTETPERMDASELYRVLRPFGGRALILCSLTARRSIRRWLQKAEIPDREIRENKTGIMIRRNALPGAGRWTHPMADAGRSGASEDHLARLPLKVQWFGRPGPAPMVSRHFRPPVPISINGRLFTAGRNILIAQNAYNGRILWKKEISEMNRWPASHRGGCIVADEEAVYVMIGKTCLRLDAASGRKHSVYQAPESSIKPLTHLNRKLEKTLAYLRKFKNTRSFSKSLKPNECLWETLSVTKEWVIGSLGTPHVHLAWHPLAYPVNHGIFVLHKQSGAVKWVYQSERGIDSNAIAVSKGHLYLIDGLPVRGVRPKTGKFGKEIEAVNQQLLAKSNASLVLKALDLSTGRVRWQTNKLHPRHSALWVKDETVVVTDNHSQSYICHGRGEWGSDVRAFDTRSGTLRWTVTPEKCLQSPAIVGTTVFTPGTRAFGLTTGQPVRSKDPLTGNMISGYYGLAGGGCGKMVGSTHLLMIRSGGLGFYDLCRPVGLVQYSAVRGSCFINTIAANGLVLVPDGSGACSCAYSLRTSLALTPSNRQNHWGVCRPLSAVSVESPLQQLRVNFGAPGDRTDNEGHIWFSWPRPSTSGPRGAGGMNQIPKTHLPIQPNPSEIPPQWFARNPDSTLYQNTPHAWLYSFGFKGPYTLCINTGGHPEKEQTYKVILHLARPPGETEEQVCRIQIQDQAVVCQLNEENSTDAYKLSAVRQATITARGNITIEVAPVNTSTPLPVLCGLELKRVKRLKDYHQTETGKKE